MHARIVEHVTRREWGRRSAEKSAGKGSMMASEWPYQPAVLDPAGVVLFDRGHEAFGVEPRGGIAVGDLEKLGQRRPAAPTLRE